MSWVPPKGRKAASFLPLVLSSKEKTPSYTSGFYRVEGLCAAAPPPPCTAPQGSIALSCDPQQGTWSIPQHWGLESAHRWERLNSPQLPFVSRMRVPQLVLSMGTCAHICHPLPVLILLCSAPRSLCPVKTPYLMHSSGQS